MALALMALMLCLPAQAGRVFEANTLNELFGLLCQGYSATHDCVEPDDTIRLNANITYSTGVTDDVYLFIPANATRTLDLNGKTLKSLPTLTSSTEANVIQMHHNSTLNICDTQGGGMIINDTQVHFVNNAGFDNPTFHQGTYYINSACIVNKKGRYEDPAAANCTVNIYGGSIIAKSLSQMNDQCSAILCRPDEVAYNGTQSLLYENGGYLSDPNMTVNIYGGYVSAIRSYKYTFKTYEEDFLTVDAAWRYWQEPDLHLHFFYKDYYSNPLNINLYGGSIGTEIMAIPALTYPNGFSGTLKDGTIYGIASEDHLNNFNGVADGVKVYLNGTQTTVNALKNQDLNDKTVRFAYEPDLSVGGIEVNKDNCDDIMPWEEFKASFDFATNTLYLKSLQHNVMNTINGNIVFDDFGLNIVVDGLWKLNGRIVGHNGNCVVTAAHTSVTMENDADFLSITSNATPISLNGKNFTAKHRVRVYVYASGHNAAVSCGTFAINNAWFEAQGGTPVVDSQNDMIMNATVINGSLKNDVEVKIKPNIQGYVLSLLTNISAAGVVHGEGYYSEGTQVTVSAVPNDGYHFLRWDDGETNQQRYVTMTEDIVLIAIFEADEVINYYDITVVSEDETMGTVSGGGTHIEEGQTVTITATPNEGYEFLYWTTADGQVQGAISQWTATKDETLIAHFRVAPPADAYMLWVCGTQVTGSNSADILGDGVWCYDHATRTLSTMKMATYNIENNGFIEDWVTDAGPLTVVFNHLIDATCTTTDNVIRTAIVGTKGMTFTGSAYNGPSVTAKNMYVANFSDVFTITGHITAWLYLQNTTDFGRNNFTTAILLAGKTPSLVVNGANLEVLSGVGESTGYKVSNKTDQAANLSLINAVVDGGSISAKSLYISDNSPLYEINYLTPSIESLCAVGGFNNYFEGTNITLRAYPAAGYKFVSWSDGNTDNPRYMVMPAQNVYLDPIVEVDESIVPKGAIINASATEGQGSIVDFTSGWYAEGTELTITAVPAEGYTFVQWTDGETTNPYLLTVENGKNISITAVFQKTAESLDNIDTELQINKFIQNGILYIERNGKTYNALGTELKTDF